MEVCFILHLPCMRYKDTTWYDREIFNVRWTADGKPA